jgi:hypothetical protein
LAAAVVQFAWLADFAGAARYILGTGQGRRRLSFGLAFNLLSVASIIAVSRPGHTVPP